MRYAGYDLAVLSLTLIGVAALWPSAATAQYGGVGQGSIHGTSFPGVSGSDGGASMRRLEADRGTNIGLGASATGHDQLMKSLQSVENRLVADIYRAQSRSVENPSAQPSSPRRLAAAPDLRRQGAVSSLPWWKGSARTEAVAVRSLQRVLPVTAVAAHSRRSQAAQPWWASAGLPSLRRPLVSTRFVEARFER